MFSVGFACFTCAAPVIMLGMKSLCPGASIRVTTLELVSNFVMPTSIVTPLEENAHKKHEDVKMINANEKT